ncbi:MAG: hypothetical protein FJ385_08400 [Verrucomicrobia bacterium]|nr:hypothetical protein [Verrucomicrobiota bacterium]
MNGYLDFNGVKPVAMGCMRIVYAHPHDPDLLVKVIRPDVIEERWGKGRVWYKTSRRYRQYISYVREIHEFVAEHATHGNSPHFVQEIVGLVDTTAGLGLVTRAVRDRSGNYARSLDQLVKAGGFTPEVQRALDVVIAQLLDSTVIASDPHAGNLVFAYSEEHGDHFVIIDGLGNSNLIPFKDYFRFVNRRSKENRIRRLRRYIASIKP